MALSETPQNRLRQRRLASFATWSLILIAVAILVLILVPIMDNNKNHRNNSSYTNN